MNKDLKRQLNTLKTIRPQEEWVSETKNNLLGPTSWIFDFELQPKVSFGSLALIGLSFFIFLFSFSGIFSDIPIHHNKVTPTVKRVVAEMQQKSIAEEDSEDIMIAAEETIDKSSLITEVNLEDLSAKEQRALIRQSTEELLAEIDALEERILRVMGNNQ